MKEFIKTHQQKIALVLGFTAVAAIGFYGGRSINSQPAQDAQLPSVSASSNYNENIPVVQPQNSAVSTAQAAANPGDCTGKIKGSSSHIYHMPGGAFYDKTTRPIACFDTEAEAVTAGFRKSAR